MIAAIYARRSKEQDDAEDETKSVNRQVENARVFATAKGWTVLDEHIYIDDGISGASTRLRAKARMLDAILASKTPPFDVLICQAADRFSRRDGDESFAELKTLSKAGVQVWFYSDGTCFRWGTFEANVNGFLKGEFAAEYRRAVSQKTYEAHRRMAQFGHVTGGRTFGYDNVEVDKHVERRVNEIEAAVVRRIFDLCATGTGYIRITELPNAEGAAYPKPFKGRPPLGWSPTSVRDVLHRGLYRGVLMWKRTKKRDLTGDVNPTRRSEAEWPGPTMRTSALSPTISGRQHTLVFDKPERR